MTAWNLNTHCCHAYQNRSEENCIILGLTIIQLQHRPHKTANTDCQETKYKQVRFGLFPIHLIHRTDKNNVSGISTKIYHVVSLATFHCRWHKGSTKAANAHTYSGHGSRKTNESRCGQLLNCAGFDRGGGGNIRPSYSASYCISRSYTHKKIERHKEQSSKL